MSEKLFSTSWGMAGGGRVGQKVETRRQEVTDLGSDVFPFFFAVAQ